MTFKSLEVWNLDASEYELSPGDQLVDIIANTDAIHAGNIVKPVAKGILFRGILETFTYRNCRRSRLARRIQTRSRLRWNAGV